MSQSQAAAESQSLESSVTTVSQSSVSSTSSQTQFQGWIANSSALQASNLLQLATNVAEGGRFVENWNRLLQRGLKFHRRDCMDMAGKVSKKAFNCQFAHCIMD